MAIVYVIACITRFLIKKKYLYIIVFKYMRGYQVMDFTQIIYSYELQSTQSTFNEFGTFIVFLIKIHVSIH